MKKSALIIFIICVIVTVLLGIAGIIFFVMTNRISHLFEGSDYVAAGTGARKDSYVITIPDVTLLNKYQNDNSQILLIFMASWCHFCQDEAEDLNKYMNDHPEKEIIVVSHDDVKDDIEGFLIEHGYNWFVIFDPDTLIRNYIDPDGSGIPAAYLIDSNNNVIKGHVGKLDYAGIEELYEK